MLDDQRARMRARLTDDLRAARRVCTARTAMSSAARRETASALPVPIRVAGSTRTMGRPEADRPAVQATCKGWLSVRPAFADLRCAPRSAIMKWRPAPAAFIGTAFAHILHQPGSHR